MSDYAIVTAPMTTDSLCLRGQREDDRLAAWQRYSFFHPALPEVVEVTPGGLWWRGSLGTHWTGNRAGRRIAAALFVLLLPAAGWAAEPACKVNVATCKAAECAYLPGIGPSKGAAIEAAHPKTEAELDAVPGIGEKTLEKLRPLLAYQGPTTCTSKQVAPRPEAADKGGAQ